VGNKAGEPHSIPDVEPGSGLLELPPLGPVPHQQERGAGRLEQCSGSDESVHPLLGHQPPGKHDQRPPEIWKGVVVHALEQLDVYAGRDDVDCVGVQSVSPLELGEPLGQHDYSVGLFASPSLQAAAE
jgi:hypothetical protein